MVKIMVKISETYIIIKKWFVKIEGPIKQRVENNRRSREMPCADKQMVSRSGWCEVIKSFKFNLNFSEKNQNQSRKMDGFKKW